MPVPFPICRCSILAPEGTQPDVFISGGGLLQSANIQIGEADRVNTCQFTVHDPNLTIGAKYWALFKQYQGIPVPDNLFGSPASESSDGDDSSSSSGVVDLEDIPDGLQGDELAKVIVAYAKEKADVTDNAHIAACLGTCEIESSMGVYLSEIGGESASYAPWYGRGLVQVTHESNYQKVGEKFGHDFIANPDDLTKLKYAVPALVLGMKEGWYTGKKLSDYGSGSSYDYDGSRNIVNPGETGTRRNNYISYAKKWYERLEAGELDFLAISPEDAISDAIGGGLSEPTEGDGREATDPLDPTPSGRPLPQPGNPPVTPAEPTDPNQDPTTDPNVDPNAPAEGEDTEDATDESSGAPFKGIEVVVEFGFNTDEELRGFRFVLIGVSSSQDPPYTTTFRGQGIRYLMTKETRRVTYENFSLRQLATEISKRYGYSAKFAYDWSFLDKPMPRLYQAGVSDYNFLLDIANYHGLQLQEDTDTASLHFLNVDLPPGTTPADTVNLPTSNTELDDIVNIPGFETPGTRPDFGGPNVPGIGDGIGGVETDVPSAEEDPNNPTPGTDTAAGEEGEETTGPPLLPVAPPITLTAALGCLCTFNERADGNRVIGQGFPAVTEIAELQGTSIGKGFEVSVEFPHTTRPIIGLAPGAIATIDASLVGADSPYLGQYRVGNLRHDWNGKLRSTVDLYVPVKVKKRVSTSDESDTDTETGGTSGGTGTNAEIAAQALTWVDKEYNPGVGEQCMAFVRNVLTEVDHPLAEFVTSEPYDGLSTGRNLASSLSGPDCGTQISDKGSVAAGDIIFFQNTYGSWPEGTITHVGIAVDDGSMIVDRSTSSAPVRHRTIDTFTFTIAVRLRES